MLSLLVCLLIGGTGCSKKEEFNAISKEEIAESVSKSAQRFYEMYDFGDEYDFNEIRFKITKKAEKYYTYFDDYTEEVESNEYDIEEQMIITLGRNQNIVYLEIDYDESYLALVYFVDSENSYGKVYKVTGTSKTVSKYDSYYSEEAFLSEYREYLDAINREYVYKFFHSITLNSPDNIYKNGKISGVVSKDVRWVVDSGMYGSFSRIVKMELKNNLPYKLHFSSEFERRGSDKYYSYTKETNEVVFEYGKSDFEIIDESEFSEGDRYIPSVYDIIAKIESFTYYDID